MLYTPCTICSICSMLYKVSDRQTYRLTGLILEVLAALKTNTKQWQGEQQRLSRCSLYFSVVFVFFLSNSCRGLSSKLKRKHKFYWTIQTQTQIISTLTYAKTFPLMPMSYWNNMNSKYGRYGSEQRQTLLSSHQMSPLVASPNLSPSF